MRRYLKIIYQYSKISQQISWEYRLSYFFRTLRIFLDVAISLAFISIYFYHTANIRDWNKEEVFLIYGIYLVVSSIYAFLCADSLLELDSLVRRGKLDFALVKPVDSQFLISFSRIWPSNVYRVLVALVITGFAVRQLQIGLTPLLIAWTLVLIVSGVVIYYSLILLVGVSSFYTSRGEAMHLMETMVSVTRYPMDIYRKQIVKMLTLVPLIFVVTVPTKILLGQGELIYYFSPLVALVLTLVSRKAWQIALRNYTSANS